MHVERIEEVSEVNLPRLYQKQKKANIIVRNIFDNLSPDVVIKKLPIKNGV